MSLILDALKKSEQQRLREKAPGLQSIHQPVTIATKKSMQPWWWLAALVIACNCIFFGYWLWRQQHVGAPAAQSTAVMPTALPAAAQPATTAEKPTQALPQTPSAESREARPEFTRISPRPVQVQTQPSATAQRIEEVNELPDSVRNDLPAMTFSFHVYSENPEQRTIIINDRRMREGDEISAGLKLQSITPDGVVLIFEQHRIHISVLSGW